MIDGRVFEMWTPLRSENPVFYVLIYTSLVLPLGNVTLTLSPPSLGPLASVHWPEAWRTPRSSYEVRELGSSLELDIS